MSFFEWWSDQTHARRGDLRRASERNQAWSRRARRERGRLRKRVQELSRDLQDLEAVVEVLVGALERQGLLKEEVLREAAEARRAAEASGGQSDQKNQRQSSAGPS